MVVFRIGVDHIFQGRNVEDKPVELIVRRCKAGETDFLSLPKRYGSRIVVWIRDIQDISMKYIERNSRHESGSTKIDYGARWNQRGSARYLGFKIGAQDCKVKLERGFEDDIVYKPIVYIVGATTEEESELEVVGAYISIVNCEHPGFGADTFIRSDAPDRVPGAVVRSGCHSHGERRIVVIDHLLEIEIEGGVSRGVETGRDKIR
jgi:hypothetical protein